MFKEHAVTVQAGGGFMCRSALLFVVVCLAAQLNAAKNVRAEETQQLEGEWQAIEVVAEGLNWDKDGRGVRNLKFVIKGNDLIVPHPSGNGNDRRKTFTLNPSITPKQINLHHRDGAEAGQTTAAIYKLEGDRLTICMPYFGNDFGTRPSEFKTSIADGRMLVVLERKKP